MPGGVSLENNTARKKLAEGDGPVFRLGVLNLIRRRAREFGDTLVGAAEPRLHTRHKDATPAESVTSSTS
jgi:hypothetical protein